jgi:hypothetical protein
MAFKILPVPADEKDGWLCLQCAMNADRDTIAVALLAEGERGKRGVTRTGICGNHAEIMDIEDLREAQRKFAAESLEQNRV